MVDISKIVNVCLETENKDFFRGYDYAMELMKYHILEWINDPTIDKVGRMASDDLNTIRDWIVDHK